MSENDVVVAALCMASPFCVVAGLLNGLLWRIHLALGAAATLGTIWFLAIGLMPVMLLPAIAAAVFWTIVGSGAARFLPGRRTRAPGRQLRSGRVPHALSQTAL